MHVARTAVIGHDTCIGAGTYLEDACQVGYFKSVHRGGICQPHIGLTACMVRRREPQRLPSVRLQQACSRKRATTHSNTDQECEGLFLGNLLKRPVEVMLYMVCPSATGEGLAGAFRTPPEGHWCHTRDAGHLGALADPASVTSQNMDAHLWPPRKPQTLKARRWWRRWSGATATSGAARASAGPTCSTASSSTRARRSPPP